MKENKIKSIFVKSPYSRTIREKYNLKAILLVSLIIVGVFAGFIIISQGPEIKVVSGTEYLGGEYGQLIVRVADRFGSPFRDVECMASVYYPDQTFFLTDIPMKESIIMGNYYIEFATPDIEGIYSENIVCNIGNARTLIISSSFHVSAGLNIVRRIYENQTVQYIALLERLAFLESVLSNHTEKLTVSSSQMENIRNEISMINSTISNQYGDLNDEIDNLNSSIKQRFSQYYQDLSKVYVETAKIFNESS